LIRHRGLETGNGRLLPATGERRKMRIEESGGLLLPGAPRAPPEDLNPQDLSVRNQPNRITRRGGLLQRSYRSQLDNGPIRWARTSESNPLYTSVDASRPHAASADNAGRKLVEPPGIAPGSGPLITSAFIAIVRPKPDGRYISKFGRLSKAH